MEYSFRLLNAAAVKQQSGEMILNESEVLFLKEELDYYNDLQFKIRAPKKGFDNRTFSVAQRQDQDRKEMLSKIDTKINFINFLIN